jgi:hypothetical protein
MPSTPPKPDPTILPQRLADEIEEIEAETETKDDDAVPQPPPVPAPTGPDPKV